MFFLLTEIEDIILRLTICVRSYLTNKMSSSSSSSSSSSLPSLSSFRCAYICLTGRQCKRIRKYGDIRYCSQHRPAAFNKVINTYETSHEYPLSVERVLFEHPVIPLDIIHLVSEYSQPYLTDIEIGDYLRGKTNECEILSGKFASDVIKEMFKFITDNHIFQRKKWGGKYAQTCYSKLDQLEQKYRHDPRWIEFGLDWIPDTRALCLADSAKML